MLGRIYRERCRDRKRRRESSVYRSPSSVTKEPRRNDDQGTVENCDEKMTRSATTDIPGGAGGQHTKEDENQPNVSPPVPVAHIQRGVVLIPDRDGTVPTERGVGRVIQVSAKVSDELVSPSRARLVRRWVEDGEFFRVAYDFETAVKRSERGRLGLCWKGRSGRGEGTYCSSVVSIELVILTQGFNSYNHTRNQP